LVIRGIDPYRLRAKGYGERVPRTLQKEYRYNGFVIPSGTKLTEEYINKLPKEVQEYAHQLNRRTEFKVISKDYVPREDISDEEMANVQIRPEDNVTDFLVDQQGFVSFKAIINAYTERVTYNKDFTFGVSQKKVMELLNDGIITKDDFVGDVSRIIKVGAVADRAQFIIREMHIADRSVQNIKVTVYNNLKTDWLIGQETLKQFGDFNFDKDSMKLIFNKE
jgi:peptidoglycan-associated lipoprotein